MTFTLFEVDGSTPEKTYYPIFSATNIGVSLLYSRPSGIDEDDRYLTHDISFGDAVVNPNEPLRWIQNDKAD